jgi:hypothetical protein
MVEHLNSCIMSAQEFKFFVSEISFKFIYCFLMHSVKTTVINLQIRRAYYRPKCQGR